MIGRELLSELKNLNVKFTEEDIVFITKDKEGKLIWLERGNENAGLKHILANHGVDFETAYNIKSDEISLYLHATLTNGKVISSVASKVKGGLDRVYEYDGKYYTFVGMGDNGYIVTAFPTKM